MNYLSIPNLNDAAVEVWEWLNILLHTLLDMRLLIHAEIEVSPY